MRFDNIVTLLDRAKLLKQTSLFELIETIIFGEICSAPSSTHPFIWLSVRPSVYFCYFLWIYFQVIFGRSHFLYFFALV